MSSPGGVERAATALELQGIQKRFGTVHALAGVDFVARAGTVHALLGENGAGKTTLMRIAYGLSSPDAGAVRLYGASSPIISVRDAVRAGLGMVQQHLSLVPSLTAAENLVLGGHGRFAPERAATLLRETSRAAGLPVDPDALVRDLSIVEQQRLEILKTLARGARVLILDEPTAILAPTESASLLSWIRDFAARGGSVVLVTHKLREALSVADDVTVLRRGRVTFASTESRAALTEADLTAAMFPEGPETSRVPAIIDGGHSGDDGDVVVADAISVTDARGAVRVRSVTLRVRRGEIIGVAGVEGAGHRELLSAIAGVRRVSAGTIARPARVALIPADRGAEGLIGDFTLVENVALREAGLRRGRMPWAALEARTRDLVERFAIRIASVSSRALELSGGNQQRLVIARELGDDVDLVVADNPARGLDLRATRFVHDQLRRAARSGAAIVVHSSDTEELLDLATRLVVMFDGTLHEVPHSREAVSQAMVGALTPVAS